MHISNKCSIAIHCLVYIHTFGSSKKVTSEQLFLSTGSNPVTIRTIMSVLRQSGIIAIQTGTGGAALAKKPEEITMLQICNAVEPDLFRKFIGIHPYPSDLCSVGKHMTSVLDHSYDAVRSALAEGLRSVTLAHVLEEYAREAANDPKN